MDSDIRQLALDTLHARSEQDNGREKSCFMVNRSARALRALGSEAIPVLEELIRGLVVPAMDEYRKSTGIPNWQSIFRDAPPFPGLSEFLGAYWIICARSDPERAVSFMKTMTKPVVNEAVSRLSTFFNPVNKLSDVALPQEYVEYLDELISSGVDEFGDVARYVIERLGVRLAK